MILLILIYRISHKPKKKLEVGVGIGIFLIDKKEQKILIGKRPEGGLFGLPGGWLEFNEEFEETAQRELKEETGLLLEKRRFKHIKTLNCIWTEYKYHNLSVVMYAEIDSDERRKIINAEPEKCCGWFWTTIEELRKEENLSRLFYPIRTMLEEMPSLKTVGDLKKLVVD